MGMLFVFFLVSKGYAMGLYRFLGAWYLFCSCIFSDGDRGLQQIQEDEPLVMWEQDMLDHVPGTRYMHKHTHLGDTH